MLADIFTDALAALSFKDTLVGEVYPLEKRIGDKIKIYPVSLQTPSTCDNSDYVDLVPNDTKKSIIYLEKGNTTVDDQDRRYAHMRESWRLVVWLHTKIIDQTKKTPYPYMQEVYSLIPTEYGNLDEYINVFLHFTGMVTDKSIFSRYTYNEVEKQFLIYPFSFFAFDYDITYWWRQDCMIPVPANPNVC